MRDPFWPPIDPDHVPSEEIMSSTDPKEHPTLELPKVDVPRDATEAVLLEIRMLGERVDTRFDGVDSRIDHLFEDKKSMGQRMTAIEARFDRFEERYEERARTHSGGIAKVSTNDASQDAAIANVITKVDSIETKVDALTARPDTADLVLAKVTELGKTPTGQKLVGGVLTVLMLVLTLLAANLKAKVDAIEAKPAAPAPAVSR